MLQKDQYPKGFYLVYIVNTDDEKCASIGTTARANRTKQVSFTIQETVYQRLTARKKPVPHVS